MLQLTCHIIFLLHVFTYFSAHNLIYTVYYLYLPTFQHTILHIFAITCMSAYVHVCMFLTVGQTARPIWTKLIHLDQGLF